MPFVYIPCRYPGDRSFHIVGFKVQDESVLNAAGPRPGLLYTGAPGERHLLWFIHLLWGCSEFHIINSNDSKENKNKTLLV